MPDYRLKTLLAGLLLGVYLLVYVPQIGSIDGAALLAASAALVRHGVPEIGVVAAEDSLIPFESGRMGAFGLDGALYSKKGLVPSLALIPFVLLSEALPWLDTRATAMLLNPLATTATALALYSLVRDLHYRPRTAFVTALIYGLATLAVVYVKTLFGEPLSALLMLVAARSVFYARRGEGSPRVICRHDLIAGTCLGLLIGVNLICVVFVPALAIYRFWPRLRALPLSPARAHLGDMRPYLEQPSTREGGEMRFMSAFLLKRGMINNLLAFALPVLVVLTLIGLYNLARFGSPLDSGYHFGSGEGFIHPVLLGLYGLLFSPYRGLFWYSPVLLLAVPGWLMLRRHISHLAWLAAALTGLQLLAFAGWWSWHGGIVWGPRFLIPVLPLLALCLAPLVEAAWTRLVLAAAVAGLTLLSLGVQALGALYSFYPYTGYLYTHYYTGDQTSIVTGLADAVLYTPELSPIIGHLALAAGGAPLEPAWAANGIDTIHLLAALALLLAGLVHSFTSNRLRHPHILILVALIALNIVAARQQRGEMHTTIRALEAALQPSGTIMAATAGLGAGLIDLEIRQPVLSTNAPTRADDPLAAPLWDYALRQDSRLWLVTWFSPANADNWQERDLWSRASFVRETAAAGYRALLFHLDTVPPEQMGGWRFGPIRLEAYGQQVVDDGVLVAVSWSAVEAPPGDYTWFIHLLDADGNIVAQQDRPPLGGYAPTSSWQPPGQPIIDRLFFPGDFPAGVRLRIGWLDPAAGQFLPAQAADGTILGQGFAVIE